jgi:hypothetical protein
MTAFTSARLMASMSASKAVRTACAEASVEVEVVLVVRVVRVVVCEPRVVRRVAAPPVGAEVAGVVVVGSFCASPVSTGFVVVVEVLVVERVVRVRCVWLVLVFCAEAVAASVRPSASAGNNPSVGNTLLVIAKLLDCCCGGRVQTDGKRFSSRPAHLSASRPDTAGDKFVE